MKRKNTKGFTLIEIIVVLIIIAILAAIAVPALMKYINDAKEKQILAEVRSVYIAATAALAETYVNDISEDTVFQTTRPFNSSNMNNGATFYAFTEGSVIWNKVVELAPFLTVKNDFPANGTDYAVYGSYASGVTGVAYTVPDSNAPDGYTCYIFVPGVGMNKLPLLEAIDYYGVDAGIFG